MNPFHRRVRLSPDFLDVPAESSVTQQLAELHSRTDAALRLIDGLAAGPDPDVRDAVLEVRLVLRPAVPVVQGYVDTHANKYWENP